MENVYFNILFNQELLIGLALAFSIVLTSWNIYRLYQMRRDKKLMRFGPATQIEVERPAIRLDRLTVSEDTRTSLEGVIRDPHTQQNIAGNRNSRFILFTGCNARGMPLVVPALACEAGIPLIRLPSTIWLGAGGNKYPMGDLVRRISQQSPAFVFLDGLDDRVRQFSDEAGSSQEAWESLSLLLERLDHIKQVKVIAAVENSSLLPISVRGWFEREIILPLPARRERLALLEQFCRLVHLAPSVNLNLLATTTTGLREAEMKSLCNRAVECSEKQGLEQVCMGDFSAALEWLLLQEGANLLMLDDQRRTAAYHAAGHLLAAWKIPGAIPRRKISILPDDLGENRCSLTPIILPGIRTRTELLAELAILLSGMAAEEIALGEKSNLVEADLQHATWLAQQIVLRWGMGSLGPLALVIDDQDLLQGWSVSTLSQAENEIRQLIENYYQAACNILIASREQLDRLAEALIFDEQIDLAMQTSILGTRFDHVGSERRLGSEPASREGQA